jgi:YHS domain-containing protein
MNILRASVALALIGSVAWAVQGKPVNDTCPVKGSPVKANVTTVYKGKTVAFCWNNCKGQFDSNPEKFAASIPGLSGPAPRTGLNSAEEALTAAKEGNKPAVILFADAGAKSKMFSEMLGDASLDDAFGKVSYAMVEFKKDGETEKKFKVTAAPTLVIIDASKDEPKELKKMQGGNPGTVKKEIDAAAKKLEKK